MPATAPGSPGTGLTSAQPGRGRPRRDLLDVGSEHAGQPGQRLDRQPRELADRRGQHAQPHRPVRPPGRASRFAGSEASERRSKWWAISGRGGERRRHRHRHALGERSARGRAGEPLALRAAVASGAVQSAIPITAAKLSCQPTSPAARGLSTRVKAAASSIAYQREAGPAGEGGDDPGGAHHACPLDRRTGPGDRDVDGDQGEHAASEPAADRQARQRASNAASRAAPAAPRSGR